jgi:drug/metabolite transporter (DMT)-like permease
VSSSLRNLADNTSRVIAIAEALCAAVILGSTLVLSKIALNDLGPLTLTALRYTLAFILLVPFLLLRGGMCKLPNPLWKRFILLGVSFYVVGNGALYLGLRVIPATTASLLLSFVPLIVLIIGIFFLREIPTRTQWFGTIILLVGALVFFTPGLSPGEPIGIAIVCLGLIGNALFSLMGREVQRDGAVDTLTLTALPMGISIPILLPLALLLEGLPKAPITTWAVLFLLAGLNTAIVYAMMNHALKELAAFEMAVITNLTPIITAIWSWIILDEILDTIQLAGLIIATLGVILVVRGQHREVLSNT